MRMLLIEDDDVVAHSIELMLKFDGHEVCRTASGEEGAQLGKLYNYNIIILDLTLPDVSGYEVLRELRAANVETPVLILSGFSEIANKVKGLGFGADDYLTKPFHQAELIARIEAVARRANGRPQAVVMTGDMVVDLDQQVVKVSGIRIYLTAKEYKVLELLSLRKGMALTKDMFISHLYGGRDEPDIKIIDVFICKIRRKLASVSPGRNYIETIWGSGYMLREPISDII